MRVSPARASTSAAARQRTTNSDESLVPDRSSEIRPHSFDSATLTAEAGERTGEANAQEGVGALLGGLGSWAPSAEHGEHPKLSFEQLRDIEESRLDSTTSFSPDLRPETRAVALEASALSSHAQAVTSLLAQEGDLQPGEIETRSLFSGVSPEILTAEGSATPSERLDSFLELGAASGLSTLNRELESLRDQNSPSLRGVNVSAGMSTLTQFMNLSDLSFAQGEDGERTLSPEGRVIFDALGLPHDVGSENMRRFTEQGIGRIQEVVDGSPLVQEQRERHQDVSQDLQDQGVHYVVAAGNEGNFLSALQTEGMRVPDSADDNYFSNPYNFTVGSLDDHGTGETSDDSLFTQTSMSPEVDILAPGVNREVETFGQTGFWTGTSFAAPDALGVLIKLSDQNPQLSAVDIQQLLQDRSGSVQGTTLPGLR